MELVWSVDCDEEFDVYSYARRLMDICVENLEADGYLQAAVHVVSAEKIYCFAVEFEGYDDKTAEYGRVVEFAKENRAMAIVTINDAYLGTPEDGENYYPGKLKELQRGEAIQITVTGPDIKNVFLRSEYKKHEDKFVISEPVEEAGGSVNFLHDWPANLKSVN